MFWLEAKQSVTAARIVMMAFVLRIGNSIVICPRVDFDSVLFGHGFLQQYTFFNDYHFVVLEEDRDCDRYSDVV